MCPRTRARLSARFSRRPLTRNRRCRASPRSRRWRGWPEDTSSATSSSPSASWRRCWDKIIEMLTLQNLIAELSDFWARQGCLIEQPYDLPMGAGTMHPATFLKVLGPEPWRCAYVQPSRRPADGRYGENPFRLAKHLQLQVVLKPSPDDVQSIFLASLERLGIVPADHDIRFEEDNWESPTLGAWGVGWQVVMDGMEITQFTYFQQAGGIDLSPVTAEITYGLERIAMFLSKVNSIFDVMWNEKLSYGRVRRREEVELSRYAFEIADVELAMQLFERYEKEARRTLEA